MKEGLSQSITQSPPKTFLEAKSPSYVHARKTNELVRLYGGMLTLVSGRNMCNLKMTLIIHTCSMAKATR